MNLKSRECIRTLTGHTPLSSVKTPDDYEPNIFEGLKHGKNVNFLFVSFKNWVQMRQEEIKSFIFNHSDVFNYK